MRVVVKWSQGAQAFSNVLHYTKNAFTVQDMQDAIDDMDTWIGGYLAANVSTNIHYDGIDGYDLRTAGGQVVTQNASAGNGGMAGDMMPINVALVVTRRTATRGQSGRGRIYVGHLPESTIADGVYNAGAINQALSYADNLDGQAVANGWTPVIVQRWAAGQELEEPLTHQVTDNEVRSGVPGTQRRRLDRG